MLAAFEEMGINMSLKIHMLKNHLDFFHMTWEKSPMNMVKDSTKP
jgi:hypothetical protein